jgi:hypothetical protein
MGKMVTLSTVTSGFADAILGQPNASITAPTQNAKLTGPPVSGAGSGAAPSNVPSAAVANTNRPYGDNVTDSNLLSPVTVVINPAAIDATGFFDIPVFLARPTRKIFIASEGPNETVQTGFLGISLQPTGIPSPMVPLYAPEGTESWIPLRNGLDGSAVVDVTGIIIEFAKPITRFYVQAFGTNFALTTDNVTFLSADDLCSITWRPTQPSND